MSWGPCVSCKWWQLEPKTDPSNLAAGLCIEEKLQPFKLRISGLGGCNRFREGRPARAKGSSSQPPTAAPVR